MDVQSKNNVWDLTGWMSYIKYGLLGLGLLIVVVIILRIMFIFKLAIGNSFRRMIPPTWRRRNTSGTDPNDPSMIPMLAAASYQAHLPQAHHLTFHTTTVTPYLPVENFTGRTCVLSNHSPSSALTFNPHFHFNAQFCFVLHALYLLTQHL